jgi:two-component system OmpR family sensor kinase
MPGIASFRHRWIVLAWGGFAVANLAAMWLWPHWETIPFHFIWVSLTLLYGFRVWPLSATAALLLSVVVATGVEILNDAVSGTQLWGELFEVPLMSAMFLAMVWHARRRQHALEAQKRLVERQEQFIHDASHELRTPVTIARGHLELLLGAEPTPEIDVALDELSRIEAIVERLLLLAKAAEPDFIVAADLGLEQFLEEVFMRWAEVAPRAWQLGELANGTVSVDAEAIRTVLDALVEYAVRYTEPLGVIELRAHGEGTEAVIEIVDHGCGVDPANVDQIFERFARTDVARGRDKGGVGLGLAIVDAIAKAHGGRCTVRSSDGETVFALHLPRFRPVGATPNGEPAVAETPAGRGPVPGG